MGRQLGPACFAMTFHNFVPPVIIVAMGPTNLRIKGFCAGAGVPRGRNSLMIRARAVRGWRMACGNSLRLKVF